MASEKVEVSAVAEEVPQSQPQAEAVLPEATTLAADVAAAAMVPSASADAAAAPPGVPEKVVDDATYGLYIDPANAFSTARDVASQMHLTLGALKLAKAVSDGTDIGSFPDLARDLQLQLLALRRSHRAMAKAAETGRTAEAAARRAADAEFAQLETRTYESACCRAAARRCRSFPTPQLSKLRPCLEGGDQEDEEEGEDGTDGEINTALARRLHSERKARAELAEELETLEAKRTADLEAFRKRERLVNDLASKLRAAEVSLEPVCDMLNLRPLQERSPQGARSSLPVPLQLILSKFEVLASFGTAGGITVQVEDSSGSAKPAADGVASSTDAAKAEGPSSTAEAAEPPEKRARTDAAAATATGGAAAAAAAVRVGISHKPGDAAGGDVVVLRFACAAPPSSNGSAVALVGVECERVSGEALLDGLWPEDDALARAATAVAVPGRVYGWVQVLGGLRDKALPLASAGTGGGPLMTGTCVTASDVVLRARAFLAKEGAK